MSTVSGVASTAFHGAFALREANYDFTVRLYRQLREQQNGNLVFSPLSIQLSVGMAWAGARGETAREMADVLGFEGKREQALVGIRDGLQRLRALTRNPINYRAELGLVQRVQVTDATDLRPDYIRTLADDFFGDTERVDWRDRAAARDRTNAWVAQTTRGLIPELVPDDGMRDPTAVVLLSALYHRAAWNDRFRDAHPGEWNLSGGKRVKTPMMYRRGVVRSTRLPDVLVLQLGYAAPGFSFVVLLPPEGQPLETLEQGLSGYSLLAWPAFLTADRLDVYFPKYSLGPGLRLRLRPALVKLGMGRAFDGRADLSGMSPKAGLVIEDVYHDATIQVDEQGTTAAAAAGTHAIPVNALEKQFKVDRPFLFFIREEESGLILLFGRVTDPRPAGGR
jgi:serpin B